MAIKILALSLLLAWPVPGPVSGQEPEISPQKAQAEELSAVRDKLMTSLFFRGELADRILDADMAGRFVDLDGIETNAGAKSALLEWIRRNPAKAAEVYLNIKGAGGRLHDRIETRELAWQFNSKFLDVIKALGAAAGNSSVSGEALELAASRLYGGSQAQAEGPVVAAGGARTGGGSFFSGDYAAYRLDKAGLHREVSKAGVWLGAARAGALQLGLEGPYSSAFSLYSDFVVAASDLKGRAAVTERESARLESLRGKLRSALAALSIRSRISALASAEAYLKEHGAGPGSKELLLAISRLKGGLEASAARVEEGGAGLRELGRLVNSAENDFAALYLRYSAYCGLLSLKNRAGGSGFSCFYDYAVHRYLAAFFPRAAYPAARAELAAASGRLDDALLKAGAGDLAEALSGFDAGKAEAAAAAVRSASSFNRGAQFFLWGLLFRPVELKVSVSGGRAAFRPAFTLSEVAGRK